MSLPLPAFFDAGAATAFAQVILIDLAPALRRRAIVLGLGGAVVMLIGLALIATRLLDVVGLLLAGGLLLLWVCWKMWRDLRAQGRAEETEGQAALQAASGRRSPVAGHGHGRPARTMGQALVQILAADLTMSLDNVLAVAGAAREHPFVLVGGLLLSITFMGLAASWIARLLHRFRWIGYLGLLVVFYVALHMIWDGYRSVIVDTGQTARYNAAMPSPLDITPKEMKHKGQ